MVQWLYLAGVIAVLLAAWKFAIRPWLERRASPVDDRHIASRSASTDARNRRWQHKDNPDALGGGPG
jgi:hypothetical protein